MLARLKSAVLSGVEARVLEVEVDVANGLPSFMVVGLPDTTVRESRDRVAAAIKNSGFEFPMRRVTVNLAPAGVRKEGVGLDLPIAIAILAATEQIEIKKLSQVLMMGELMLDGAVRSIKGVLSVALELQGRCDAVLIIPSGNVREACLARDIRVLGVGTLSDTVQLLSNGAWPDFAPPTQVEPPAQDAHDEVNLADVIGQYHAKRALEIAAAGRHHILMIGPPGSGKTMLARRLISLLPPMDHAEAVEVTQVYSAAGMLPKGFELIQERPFRSPHHTISDVGLVGGGHSPRPGEISLAHRGVLFLDETPEFRKNVLEVLRQPLEDSFITVTRASYSVRYPALFVLVAAMNPCPCGYLTDKRRACQCAPLQVRRYLSKISGPLLDRLDLHVEVPALESGALTGTGVEEPSMVMRQRVLAARSRQEARYGGEKSGVRTNGELNSRQVRRHCNVDEKGQEMLKNAIQRLGLSARSYHRVLKVSRTIADLEGAEGIEDRHIAEALNFRGLERGGR